MGFVPFRSENGCRLWCGVGYGFRGNCGTVCVFIVFIPNEYEREIFEFEVNFKKSFHDSTSFLALTSYRVKIKVLCYVMFFCWRSILSNDDPMALVMT